MTPRVSVVLPTHNRLCQLKRALSSVWNQTFHDFEIIVVVDGATDGTPGWLQSSGKGLRTLVMNTTVGAAEARNQGVKCAQGELIAFLDDDDVWRPSYLETQIAQLDSHPDADLVYSAHVNVDDDGHETFPDIRPLFAYTSPLTWLLAECFVHTLSLVVCRRRIFDDVGGFDSRLIVVHDLDWYARLLATGKSFVHMPSTLVERSTPGGLVTSHRDWFQEERLVINRIFRGSLCQPKHRRMVRASRALFFARVGLAKGDIAFGSERLFEALLQSPYWLTLIVARRLGRRLVRLRPTTDVWNVTGCDA
jgi:glycosyltransferase involved in cell wall biosynthesis